MQTNNAQNTPASQQVSQVGAAGKGHATTLRGIGIGTRLIDDDPDGPEVPPIAPSSIRTSADGARYAVWYLDQPCDPNALDGLATLFHQDRPERAYALPPEEWPETSNGSRCTVQQLLKGFSVSNVEVLPVKAKMAEPARHVSIPPSTPVPEDVARHNDAIVHGDLHPALLNREIEISLSKAGQKTMPGRWKNATMTVGALVNVLSRHKEGSKDGECILQGAVIDGERRANAIRHLDLLMLDLDTGEDIDSIISRVKELGLFAVVWTTHSHLKPVSEVKKDEVMRFTGDTSGAPDVDQVRAYFLDKKRYRPEILEGAKLLETAHTKDGVVVRLEHKPMPKFRILFVLKDRFVIADRGASQKAALTEWKERFAGASKMLGAFFDRSTTDCSRLMFLPRHPKGATDFRIDIIAGKPLDIDTCERVTAEELKAGGATPWDAAAKALGAGSGTDNYQTTSLKWFFGKYGDRFEIDDFLLEMDPDGDRGPRSSGPGRTHCCPNDDAHSDAGNPDDKGFFCVNASESQTGQATARCSHDACQEVDRIGFVDLICAREGIKDANELKRWVPEIEGDEEEAEAAKPPVTKKHRVIDDNKQAILDWNRQYAFVGTGSGRFLRFHAGSTKVDTYSVQAFKTLKANERHFYEVGKDVKAKPFVDHWIQDKDCRKYGGLTFRPGKPDAYDESGLLKDGEVSHPDFNVWRGWGVEPKHGDCSILLDHVRDVLASGDETEYENIMGWLAYGVQHLGDADNKLPVHLVFTSDEGTGKSLFFRAMCRIYGEHGISISQSNQIVGKFNAALATACFVVAEEAVYAEDKAVKGALKAVLSEPSMQLERKGLDPVTVPNFMSFVFLSNEERPVPIDAGSRRYHCLKASDCRKGDDVYFARLRAEVLGDGPAKLLHHLLNWQPPGGSWAFLSRLGKTEANAQMVAAKLAPFESFMIQWIVQGWMPFIGEGEVETLCLGRPCKIEDIAQAYAYFVRLLPVRDRANADASPVKVGMMLTKLFPDLGTLHTRGGNARDMPDADTLAQAVKAHRNKGLAYALKQALGEGCEGLPDSPSPDGR